MIREKIILETESTKQKQESGKPKTENRS